MRGCSVCCWSGATSGAVAVSRLPCLCGASCCGARMRTCAPAGSAAPSLASPARRARLKRLPALPPLLSRMSLASMRSRSSAFAPWEGSTSNFTSVAQVFSAAAGPASARAAAPIRENTPVTLMASFSSGGSAFRMALSKSFRNSGAAAVAASSPATVTALLTRVALAAAEARTAPDQTECCSPAGCTGGSQGCSSCTLGPAGKRPAAWGSMRRASTTGLAAPITEAAATAVDLPRKSSTSSVSAWPLPRPASLPARATSFAALGGSWAAAITTAVGFSPLAAARQPSPIGAPLASAKFTR
mmetsp:Transcript_17588/g.56320  ORF Transcript_17588/g.56320 Transcript_17588/m.56320 type:complete len:301 (-) Transcript_17588:1155-2057(-)